MKPIAEISIENDVRIVDGKAIVEGRCYHGPIYINQNFNQLCRVWCVRIPEGFGPEQREAISDIDLTVRRIWAYGHDLLELSEGMTCRLEVTGVGIEKINRGLTLALMIDRNPPASRSEARR